MQAVSPNRNMLWARAAAQELARSGVAHAVVCPGNRSGPLAFALAAEPIKLWSHVDERSAGYFALGLAKALRQPVAVLTTSGTAAANLLPSVVEARHGRVPLVVLTADRPHDLRDTGANQAIDQVHLYGRFVRWSADVAPPVAEDRALRHLRVQCCRAVALARGPPAGPVHLNFPFAKPLEPTPVPGDMPPDFARRFPLAAGGRPGGAPFVQTAAARRRPGPGEVAPAMKALEAGHGVIVAGPQDDPDLPGAAVRLARATGWPLLADPLSGLRFGPHAAMALGAYDAFLQSPTARAALRPEVAVRLGAAPTSDALLQLLEASGALQVVLDDEPDGRDPVHGPGLRVAADPALACEALAAAAQPREASWLQAWEAAERAAWPALEGALASELWEGSAIAAALEALPEGGTLVVGNSLPVRDLDRFARPRAKRVRALGNRGASGIDGVTSTALGVAAAGPGKVVLFTGDLSFYHDLPGLLAVKRLGVEAVLVVLHNDGGRIFEELPAARFEPPFRELFVTPTGLDFGHAARMFGARFARCEELKGFREELARALGQQGTTVLEARTDAARARALREQATRDAARAAGRSLSGAGPS